MLLVSVLDTCISFQFIPFITISLKLRLTTSYYWIYCISQITFTLSHLRTWTNVQIDTTSKSQTDWQTDSNSQTGWVWTHSSQIVQLTIHRLVTHRFPNCRLTILNQPNLGCLSIGIWKLLSTSCWSHERKCKLNTPIQYTFFCCQGVISWFFFSKKSISKI